MDGKLANIARVAPPAPSRKPLLAEYLWQAFCLLVQLLVILGLFAAASWSGCQVYGDELPEITDLAVGDQRSAVSQAADSRPPTADSHTAHRFQPGERIQWQWVPPQNLTIGGRVVCVPGHWHQRWGSCEICGDRTKTPGDVAQANPGLADRRPPTAESPSSVPASAPAASHAATSHPECARLAAELAGAKQVLAATQQRLEQYRKELLDRDAANFRGLDERITRNQQAVAAHGPALEAALSRLGRVERLAGDVERLAARADRSEQARAADRKSFGDRVGAVARPLVVQALIERLPAAAAPLLVSGLSLGGPVGLGLGVGGWLLGRALKGRRGRQDSLWRRLWPWSRERTVEVEVTIPTPVRRPPRQRPQPEIQEEPARRATKPSAVVIETPPLPQRTLTEQSFVPYERDDYHQAHVWACQQVSQKYPGAIGMVETLNSLIEQKLRSEKTS